MWFWAGHINHLKYVRWTSSVTYWRPYDNKRQGDKPRSGEATSPGQILEGHDLAEDSARQANLEATC